MMKTDAEPGRKYLTACKFFYSFYMLIMRSGTSSPQVLARYKKVYYTLIHEIPSIKMLIEDPSRTSMLKTMLKKVCVCAYIEASKTG